MIRNGMISLAAVLFASVVLAETREEKVRNDKEKVEAEGFWIYNDLAQAFAEAKKTGKPILVVLRCIPCHECVKLDDDLVDQDPRVRPLLEKFVCVRQVSTNGLDLSLFQYDYDQSFAVFLLNADKTIYGRFGTRSHRTHWADDVSIEGLAAALEGALQLHKGYPENKRALAGKRGPKPDVASPEKYPTLKDKFTASLNYKGDVVKSCIHCHQIGDAQRDLLRATGKKFTDQVMFPYPHPKVVGLIMDPRTRSTVKEVVKDSPAERSGFKAGDEIKSLDGQPLLSIADVQWVLHHSSDSDAVAATVDRDGAAIEITLKLPSGWRTRGDTSWRVSSWPMRRMFTGGMVLEELSDEQRREMQLPADGLALFAKHVGRYGPHAAAKNAGFRQGDVVVSIDGHDKAMREVDLFQLMANTRRPGERVPVTVVRDGKRRQLMLPMQD